MFAAFSVDSWREDGGVLRVSQKQARCSCREEQILNVEEALSKLVPVLVSSCMGVPLCVCVGGALRGGTPKQAVLCGLAPVCGCLLVERAM